MLLQIQDINTARALAKRNKDYFMVEEKLWWDLHSIFRDPAKLYALSTRPSSATVRALHCPLSHSFSHTSLKSPCAESTALSPLPLIFSYKSEKSLCGAGGCRGGD